MQTAQGLQLAFSLLRNPWNAQRAKTVTDATQRLARLLENVLEKPEPPTDWTPPEPGWSLETLLTSDELGLP